MECSFEKFPNYGIMTQIGANVIQFTEQSNLVPAKIAEGLWKRPTRESRLRLVCSKSIGQ